jgi:N-acetylmuramoyl-L-alanine amidase
MRPTKIIVHHSATMDQITYNWAAIRRYHTEQLGWADIGYHAGVELIGDSYEMLLGRPWDMDGAHTLGQNGIALGLCFVGNYSLYEPEPEMLDAGAKIVKLWRRLYNIPVSAIHKHSEYANKECPGLLFPFGEFLLRCR